MPSARQRLGGTGFGVLTHVGGLVLVLAVLSAILALDHSGDRQKQAQLLVSQIDSQLSLAQNIPWDADPEAANFPDHEVRAALVAASANIEADLLELADIDSDMSGLLTLQRENAAILQRQLRTVEAGEEIKSNQIADEAFVVFDEIRRELGPASKRFSASAETTRRYTLLGTAALMLAVYAAFALTLAVLRRTQRQAAVQSERLLQAQKMEAVGQLAGGIAHDFNNLLLGIRGFTELAQASLDPGTPAHDDLGEAIAATDRATLLTRQLLSFSREQVLQPVVVDPNAAVSGVVSLLDRLIGDKIVVKVDLKPDVPCVEADPGQLGQVIVNLAVNARDAMSTGGKLTIRTSYSDVGPFAAGEGSGPWVVIAVSDTGPGMSEETQKRMFDPFFTTKDEGAGTGLGLATVWAIVSKSHGHIDVQSELGAGTTITIYLPATDKRLGAAKAPLDGTAEEGAAATILLADDNEAVRTFAARTLARMGYTVLAAANGREALQLALPATRIDLLVTDLDMPGLSGRELAAELGHLPVLYMSGHPRDLIDEGHEGEAHFIQKPFGMADLTRAVETVLAGRSSRAAA
jgi:signal transduction histidine kinase